MLAGWWSGAMEQQLLADPGAWVRVALPITRVIHDLAAALTLGLLLVAAFLTPDTKSAQRRRTATRYAVVAALIWALTAVATLVLQYALVLGQPIGGVTWWRDMWHWSWEIDLFRAIWFEALFGALVAIFGSFTRTRGGMGRLFFLGLAGLWPIALGGHAGGTAEHDAAVNGLFVHLLGVSVWVGGLAAIVALSRRLGPALQITAERFSTVALWCFVAVALSGVLSAWVRVGTFSGLGTSYGALVIAKVLALVALGGFGWWQRGRILARWRDGEPMFVRWALMEVAVMGVATGIAVALSRTPTPVPETPIAADPVLALTGYPAPEPLRPIHWLTSYRIEWLFLTGALLAIGLYLAAVIKLARRGDRWPVGRTVCWVIGWLVFLYTVCGVPGIYGRVMFSVHMVMHMSLMMAIPLFLVLAAPVTLAMRALPARTDKTMGPREVLLGLVHSKYLNAWANPVVAGVNFFGSLILFYYTDLFELALRHHTGHVLMVVHFLATGYLFAWTLIGVDPGPKRWAPPLRMLVLLATLASHAFFGVGMMMGTRQIAGDFFADLQMDWVGDRLADQQLGGGIAWGVGELPTMVLALLVMAAWLRSDSRDAKRSDRAADRDGGAELAAYNARLAAIAEADRRRREAGIPD